MLPGIVNLFASFVVKRNTSDSYTFKPSIRLQWNVAELITPLREQKLKSLPEVSVADVLIIPRKWSLSTLFDVAKLN